MMTKTVIIGVAGDMEWNKETQMVAGKTDLEDHLFGKKSWL